MTAWIRLAARCASARRSNACALVLAGYITAFAGCVDHSEPPVEAAPTSGASGSAMSGAGGLFGGVPTDPDPVDGGGTAGASTGGAGGRCGAVPPSTEPRIDNFEDGDTMPIAEAGRLGAWHIPPLSGEQTLSFEVAPGGADETDFAVRVAMSGFDDRISVGASLRFDQEGVACPYNVSQYAGVAFYAKGSQTIELLLDSTDTWSTEFGGSCDEETQTCWDVHRKAVPLTAEWKYYEVRWGSFSQAGWGEISPFVPEHFLGLEFAVSPQAQPAEFWLDEVRFVGP